MLEPASQYKGNDLGDGRFRVRVKDRTRSLGVKCQRFLGV